MLVPFDDGTRTLALVDKGRESSVFVDPDEPDVLIEWEGRWRTLEPGDHPRSPLGQLLDRGRTLDLPEVAVQHRRHRRPRHGRDVDLVDPRRLRVVAFQDPVREADPGVVDRRHHPAPLRHDRSRLRRLRPPRLDRHVAAVDHPALLRQRLQRVPASPVLHDDPTRARRGRDDRRRRTAADPDDDHRARRPGRRSSPSRCSTSSSPGTTSSSRSSTSPATVDKYPISVGLYSFIGLYKSSANLDPGRGDHRHGDPDPVFIFGQRFFTEGIDVSGSLK